jgi:hypothetical protein
MQFSDHYQENLNDPNVKPDARGMDPTLLPHLVKVAHGAGLKVVVHIYSAADFRNAVAAGADEIAHFPGKGYGVVKSAELFQITAGDAKAAARAHIAVTTTVSWRGELKEKIHRATKSPETRF